MRDENNEAVPRPKQHDLYVCVDQVNETIYTDQIGEFPITSSRGNKYIMIMCEIDENAVLVEPMKNKTEDEMVETYQKMIDRLKTGGISRKSTSWIMKFRQSTKNQWRPMAWHGNSSRLGCIEEMQQKKLRKRLKDTLSPSFAASPHISHSRNGISCYRKPKSHAISFINRKLRPMCRHKHTHLDPMLQPHALGTIRICSANP